MSNATAAKSVSKNRGEGIIARVTGFFSRMGRFIRESYVETRHKSAWPTWAELRQFTIVVIFAVLVVAIWIGGIDFLLGKVTAMFVRSQ